MAEIKCSKCDRRYSSLRSRCPYCGTRRRSKAKRSNETENATWKLIVGLLLLAVLIIAVIVLVASAVAADKPDEEAPVESPYQEGDGVESLDNSPVISLPPSAEPSEEIILPTKAERVAIVWKGTEKTDVSLKVGGELTFAYAITPSNYEPTEVEWASSDTKVFTVLQGGEIKAVGEGRAILSVTVDGLTAECIIRVRSR